MRTAPILELVVTTCCDRDVYWLGELYSYSGWTIPRRRAAHNISLPALLGRHARLTIYDKGGNSTSARRLLRQLRHAGMAHMASASVVAMPNANGREAHTIAAHVEENFDALAAVTTFVQSDVMKLDHMMPIVHLREGLVAAAASIGTTHTASRWECAAAIVDRLASRMESAAGSSRGAGLCQVSDPPPLLCEGQGPGFRDWPCPPRRAVGERRRHILGGYTGLAGTLMSKFLRETTWPGMAVPYCDGGSLSATRMQAQRQKPRAWWAALRVLLEHDRKIKWVSALRMAHVLERLWLRIFSGAPTPRPLIDAPPDVLPTCFMNRNATCCLHHKECCCPTRRAPPPAWR